MLRREWQAWNQQVAAEAAKDVSGTWSRKYFSLSCDCALRASTMNNLFSDGEDAAGGSKSQLTINEHYAKAFEYRKEREELERRKYFYVV